MDMEEAMPKILMIGLGKMGIPMANRILSTGLSIGVFSLGGEVRTNTGIEKLKQHMIRCNKNTIRDKSNIPHGNVEVVTDLGKWFVPEIVHGNGGLSAAENIPPNEDNNHFIITCLPTSEEVKETAKIVIDAVRCSMNNRINIEGIEETTERRSTIKSLIWIDCTSGDPSETRKINSSLKESGIAEEIIMIDAPVSGGPAGAENGTLCTMVGSDNTEVLNIFNVHDTHTNINQLPHSTNISYSHPFYICRKILMCWTRPGKLIVMGGLGSGHTVKAVNNSLLGSHLLLAVEALVLLKKHGIDCRKATEVICSSSGNSLALEDRIQKHVLTGTFNYGFSFSHLVKDMRICGNLLQGYQLPLLEKSVEEAIEAEGLVSGSDDHTRIVNLSQNRNNTNIIDRD